MDEAWRLGSRANRPELRDMQVIGRCQPVNGVYGLESNMSGTSALHHMKLN